MSESDKSQGPMDLDTAISEVAGLLGKIDPEFASDNPSEEGQSEEPEDQDQADESDADDDGQEDDDHAVQDADDDADVEDDDDSDDEDTDSQPWKATRKVQVDGQEIEVTPEEALLGYQRQQATTRRFQEAAKLKKELSQQLESTQTEQQKYVQAMQVLEQAFTGALNEPNWDELRKDPAAYDRERVAFLERKEQLSQLQQARQQAEQQSQATAQQARESRLEEQRELLMTAVPEWIDSDVASKESQQMVQYAKQQYGFTDAEFGGIDDHRSLVILRKAMLYDNAKGKPGKKAKAGKASPSLKPGSKPPRGKGAKPKKAQQKALSRLKKTGSMNDALDAVLHLIDE